MFRRLINRSHANTHNTAGCLGEVQQESDTVDAPAREVPEDPERCLPLLERAFHHHAQYRQLRGIDDLNRAIVFSKEALPFCTPGHVLQLGTLVNLTACLAARYRHLGQVDDLNEAIDLNRGILSHYPPGDPDRPACLRDLSRHLSARYEELEEVQDLNEAIALDREALSLCPPGHPGRSESLYALAMTVALRGRRDDLNEALALDLEALSLHPPGHPHRAASLNSVALRFCTRYEQLGEIEDLNQAIVLGREALSLRPPGHPLRPVFLNNLAVSLASRYKQLMEVDDLNEAIVLGHEALSLCPPEHPSHSEYLKNLANHLCTRYGHLGNIDDLNQAIVLDRKALLLRPPGHPCRSASLTNLANRLSSRYDKLGEIDNLKEALVLDREALSLCPLGHPYRSASLNNLASRLFSRYNLLGEMDDLNEAIALDREALSLCPPEDPECPVSMDSLATSLSTRYEQLGGIDDLYEALDLDREALSLCSPAHSHRAMSLSNLATCLFSLYKHFGMTDDLDEALVLDREALSLRPSGHPYHTQSLNNLALHLFHRYEERGGIGDLNEVIIFNREALSLAPLGHPERSTHLCSLANRLLFRHRELGEVDDLNEAIDLDREALLLCPLGHPYRSDSLNNLADSLTIRYHLREMDDLYAAVEDKQELFGLFTELEQVSHASWSHDLFAAKSWIITAEKFHHATTLLAYETALRLLVENSAALPPLPQHLAHLKSLSSSLAVDAFSACLRNQSPTKAVELLEQGRGVFWSQLTRLRSPLDHVIASGPTGKGLADEFIRLTSLMRHTLRSPGGDQHDRVCGLNVALKKVVSEIRTLPGHARFLLPPLFSDLRRAASGGPVIVVNASVFSCDALVVFADKDPVHVSLPVTKEQVREWSSKLRALRTLATGKRTDLTTDLQHLLRALWDGVVSHIVGVLRKTCPRHARIWWCPTADFSLLPLHAAAPYRHGQEGLSDIYISSYTTTLSALVRARRPVDAAPSKPCFMAIGQANAPGFHKLPSIRTELANIERHVNPVTTFTCVKDKAARVATVADGLRQHAWVHFACHGYADQEAPFASAFALRDGMFTIQRILQCDLQNPEFAYLSACHTSVGDQAHPDEVIHLASAMQFSGFRSVVGTMWSVVDGPATQVASTFYGVMVEAKGRLAYTGAAEALWKTLRTVDIPLDQRILYVHLGA